MARPPTPGHTHGVMNERRQSERFPIERSLRFRTLANRGSKDSGEGTTVNMSSGGILFISDRLLATALRVEVCISWPAQLNDKCGLSLVVRGQVVRCDQGRTALVIQQHEFRTQSAGLRGFSPE